MPSKSKSQQRFFGMVDAYKKGEMKNPSSKIKKAAEGMSMSDVNDFAETKHKGLPEKVEENMTKKVIRMTESDLHQLVKESVQRILNEYGNTPAGKYMLGRLQKRAIQRGDRDLDDRIADRYEQTYDGMRGGYAFNKGYEDQGVADKDTIQQHYDVFKNQ